MNEDKALWKLNYRWPR